MKKKKKPINWKEEFEKLKNPKELKKLLITLFVEIVVLIMLFVACDKALSTEDDSEQEIVQKEEQTQVEQQIQKNEIEKGMTEAEREYFAQAQADIEQLVKELNEMGKLIRNAKTMEELKEAIPIAENCVTLGDKIKQLEVIEEIDTLSNLVTLFGWYAEHQGETFIEALATNDTEKMKDWSEICWPDVISCMYQLSAYIQEGKTIQEQLEQELTGILNEEEMKHMSVSDYIAVFQLEEESKENALKKIYNVLKIMYTQNKYDYLSIYFNVYHVVGNENKTATFMKISFQNSRKQIDFNTINWTDIPEIADDYWNLYENY